MATAAARSSGGRILLGPGPSNVHPRVLQALAQPLVGHLDPVFLQLMDETKALLRFVFRTQNPLTLPISGTGSAGMETCLANLIEPGDEVVVGIKGAFGLRMADMVERYGGTLVALEVPWGQVFTPEQVAAALARCRRPKLVALVHAETSTGAWQPLEEMAAVAHQAGALLLVDAVTSLGGCPLEVDAWGIDMCYSGTQKCLGCPPGLAPVTVSPAALEAIHARKTKVQSWYFDLTMLEKYWGEERVYHHTAPISMNYALHEALRVVQEEGLPARFQRHQRNHAALVAGLTALDLALAVPAEHRLWTLTSVRIPEGVDDVAVRQQLLEDYNIEIGAGLGPWRSKVWRLGLMGEGSTPGNVLLLLRALAELLAQHGYGCATAAGVAAAQAVYDAP